MTQSISSLTWQDTTDPASPVANYIVDFGVDTFWDFHVSGAYHFTQVVPVGITIDNSANGVGVVFASGPDTMTVPPYQRLSMKLYPGALRADFFCATPIKVSIQFYIKYALPDNVDAYLTNLNANNNSNLGGGMITLSYSIIGLPAAGQKFYYALTEPGVLQANGGTTSVIAGANPTGTQNFSLNVLTGLSANGVPAAITTLGTLSISAAGVVTWPIFAALALTPPFGIGLLNQAIQDATFANWSFGLEFQKT